MSGCLAVLAVLFLIGLVVSYPAIFFILVIVVSAYLIYKNRYFKSEDFLSLRDEVSSYINECNELNEHIESLRQVDSFFEKKDYGVAELKDNSRYKFKRKELNKFSNAKQVYNCSLSVCRSAQQKPFDYVCKYFNVPKDEQSLEHFEEMLNKFLAVEEGRIYLQDKKNTLMQSIDDRIPPLIKAISKTEFENKLGFEVFDFSDVHFPTYKLQYISDGGNSSMETNVTFNTDNIQRFISYLDEHIKWRDSVKGQRALMTPALRQSIKERDHFTCCHCGNSIEQEPNLLLEIDHIIPLSKGGKTELDNLQTLCWKCNRSKGSKMEIQNAGPTIDS